MSLVKLSDRSLVADQVFDSILRAIMSGEIPPGSRLRIRDLAEELGTSPMPVRDSLVRLEQVGLAQRMPHKGAVVTQLSPAELVAVYDARLLLEREATRLGAERITPDAVALMRDEHVRMMAAVDAGRPGESLDRDEALLTVLYQASGNEVLVELIGGLWQRCRAFKLVSIRGLDRPASPDIWSLQGRLIDAAERHDVAAAVAVTEESLVSATARIRLALDAPAEN